MLQGWILCYFKGKNRRFGLCILNDSSHRESCQKTTEHHKKSKKEIVAPNPLHCVHSSKKIYFPLLTNNQMAPTYDEDFSDEDHALL